MELEPGHASPLRRTLHEAPVTTALIAVQVLVLALASWKLGDVTDPQVLVTAGALERSHVQAGEWWRLLSAVFLHVGWIHLLANSIFGFGWCRIVERMLGHSRFLAVYLLAGIGASAVSLAAHDAVGAGASGALFGIIGATMVIHRRLLGGWRPFLRSPNTLSVAVQLTVWTVVAVSTNLPIDHAAHFGGLFFGAAATWLLTRPRPHRWIAWAPLALLLAAALAGATWPRTQLSAWAAEELVEQGFEALRKEDLATAERAVARLDEGGWHDDQIELMRAVVDLGHDRLTEAAATAERLAEAGGSARVRTGASRVLGEIGYRYYKGLGVEEDAALGLRYLAAACRHGQEQSCRAVRTITGQAPGGSAPAGPATPATPDATPAR